MEIKITIVNFVLYVVLIVTPLILFKIIHKLILKYKFINYLTWGVLFSIVLGIAFAWWGDISNQILLTHYGYDFDAMNQVDRFFNVAEENIEEVRSLEASIMGIGWPLKAIFTSIIYFAYLLLFYPIFSMFT